MAANARGTPGPLLKSTMRMHAPSIFFFCPESFVLPTMLFRQRLLIFSQNTGTCPRTRTKKRALLCKQCLPDLNIYY